MWFTNVIPQKWARFTVYFSYKLILLRIRWRLNVHFFSFSLCLIDSSYFVLALFSSWIINMKILFSSKHRTDFIRSISTYCKSNLWHWTTEQCSSMRLCFSLLLMSSLRSVCPIRRLLAPLHLSGFDIYASFSWQKYTYSTSAHTRLTECMNLIVATVVACVHIMNLVLKPFFSIRIIIINAK